MTTTTTGFDEHALARLPSPAPFLDAIRAQAFEAFEALPIPSQETEEWRYTDLEGFGFDLRPFVEGGRAENLDQVPEEILAAAGQVGERAGLQIQRNSEVMVTHLDPVARRQGRLVRRPGPRDRRTPRARRALPARPRPGRPLEVHRPARRVPLGGDVPVRAARRRDRAAVAGDDVDRRRGRGDLPSDAPGRGRERRGHPDRPLRLARARPGPERRDRRDPRRPRLARALRRAPGVRRRRHAPRGPAGADRPRRRPEVARGRVRREPRARRGRGAPGRGRRQLGDARRVLRRRRAAHRPSFDPGSRRLAHLERPPLQGRDARFVQRDLHGDRDHRARRAPVRRLPDQPEHPAVRPRPGAVGAEPGDPHQRPHALRPRRERRPGLRRRALLPDEPRHPREGGRAADRVRLLRRGARPRRHRRDPRGPRAGDRAGDRAGVRDR